MFSCDIHFFCNAQWKALLSINIAASAYECIDYNYGFGNLLTLYTVGTLAKRSGKENCFITLSGLACE